MYLHEKSSSTYFIFFLFACCSVALNVYLNFLTFFFELTFNFFFPVFSIDFCVPASRVVASLNFFFCPSAGERVSKSINSGRFVVARTDPFGLSCAAGTSMLCKNFYSNENGIGRESCNAILVKRLNRMYQ